MLESVRREKEQRKREKEKEKETGNSYADVCKCVSVCVVLRGWESS